MNSLGKAEGIKLVDSSELGGGNIHGQRYDYDMK